MNQTNHIKLMEASLSQFGDIYRRLLEDFPVEEVKGYEQLEGLLSGGRYKLLLAIEPDQNVIAGYAFIYVFDALPAIWLDYLAINQEVRGSGIGSLVFTELARYNHHDRGIFLEVEKPVSHQGSEREEQLRRIRFYERLGARKLPISYELPTKEGGFPMYLYYKPAGNRATITAEQIQLAISEIFSQIHSDVGERDLILKRILSSMGEV
jgi:GNAT superfamily N-acetyltransferase